MLAKSPHTVDIPADPPPKGWAAVTQEQLNGMSLEQRRAWNRWFMRTYMGVDQQAECQADHDTAVAEQEWRDRAEDMNADRTCATCRFHDRATQTCRRHPPTMVSWPDPNHDKFYEPQTTWPVVGLNDWCGEYKP